MTTYIICPRRSYRTYHDLASRLGSPDLWDGGLNQGYKIQAPEILSKIHWLGDQSIELAAKVKAKEVCQTLYLQRSQLLGLLSVLDCLGLYET